MKEARVTIEMQMIAWHHVITECANIMYEFTGSSREVLLSFFCAKEQNCEIFCCIPKICSILRVSLQ